MFDKKEAANFLLSKINPLFDNFSICCSIESGCLWNSIFVSDAIINVIILEDRPGCAVQVGSVGGHITANIVYLILTGKMFVCDSSNLSVFLTFSGQNGFDAFGQELNGG